MALSEPEGKGRSRSSERFPKADRLRRRAEFRAVQSQGRRVHTPHFILILHPRDDGRRRLGVTVTKKVGKAVERNRVKRLVREVFRRNRELFPEGCDVVCIAKKGAPTLGYEQVLEQMGRIRRAMRATARRASRARRTEPT